MYWMSQDVQKRGNEMRLMTFIAERVGKAHHVKRLGAR